MKYVMKIVETCSVRYVIAESEAEMLALLVSGQ